MASYTDCCSIRTQSPTAVRENVQIKAKCTIIAKSGYRQLVNIAPRASPGERLGTRSGGEDALLDEIFDIYQASQNDGFNVATPTATHLKRIDELVRVVPGENDWALDGDVALPDSVHLCPGTG